MPGAEPALQDGATEPLAHLSVNRHIDVDDLSWFWIVHLPRMLTSVSDGIAVVEALAVSGIALVVAGALAKGGDGGQSSTV